MFKHSSFVEIADVQLNESGTSQKFFEPLSSSEVFRFANSSASIGGDTLMNVLPRVVLDSDHFRHVNYDRLSKDAQFNLFDSRTIKLQNKEKIKKAILDGEIILVYGSTLKLPVGIPFVVRKSGNKIITYVITSEFCRINNDAQLDVVKINSLMASIITAHTAKKLLSGVSLNNAALMTVGLTYAKMFSATIAANSNIGDNDMRAKLEAIAARFFCYRVFGEDEGDRKFYSHFITYEYEKRLSKPVLDQLEILFPMETFRDINILFDSIKKNYPEIKNIDIRSFIERWIRKFGPGATFAIDYPGFMIYVVMCTIMHADQVNVKAVEAMLPTRFSDEFYNYIQKL